MSPAIIKHAPLVMIAGSEWYSTIFLIISLASSNFCLLIFFILLLSVSALSSIVRESFFRPITVYVRNSLFMEGESLPYPSTLVSSLKNLFPNVFKMISPDLLQMRQRESSSNKVLSQSSFPVKGPCFFRSSTILFIINHKADPLIQFIFHHFCYFICKPFRIAFIWTFKHYPADRLGAGISYKNPALTIQFLFDFSNYALQFRYFFKRGFPFDLYIYQNLGECFHYLCQFRKLFFISFHNG